MKKLLKLPLLLITLLLIFSCGRNVEADIETIKNIKKRVEPSWNVSQSKETMEESLELLLEAKDIFSYYVSYPNSDETISFIRLLNKESVAAAETIEEGAEIVYSPFDFSEVDDAVDLELTLYFYEDWIENLKDEIEEM